MPNKLQSLRLNLQDAHIVNTMKKTQFLDIETSLVDARVYRTGQQFIGAHQLTGTTKLLTAAGGTFYDLYTKGEEGIWAHSNHHDTKAFSQDVLNDEHVLSELWWILDEADTIVAHNGRFDEGWIRGRFMEMGWKMPSPFKLVCTYKSLYRYNLTSKKLDMLSRMIGQGKIHTDFDLWMRCSDGEVSAFEEMLEYNKGDIYKTLFKVYMYIAPYIPHRCVDLSDPDILEPRCRVTGERLKHVGYKYKPENGLWYEEFVAPTTGIYYIDRYNTKSRKAGCGLIKPQ